LMHGLWSISAAVLLALTCACKPTAGTVAPKPDGRVRFRSIVEPSAVRALAAVDNILLEVTEEGILRWNQDDALVVMASDDVLPGRAVALAAAPSQRAIWIVTNGGIGRYDLASGALNELAPPTSVGLDVSTFRDDNVAAAAANDGGLWLGTSKGLFYASNQGGWVTLPVKAAVRALAVDRSGDLWIATEQGLMRRQSSGQVTTVGSAQGCAIVKPRMIFASPSTGTVVVGADGSGRERIAIGIGARWQTFAITKADDNDSAATSAIHIDAIAEGDRELIVLSGGRLHRLAARAGYDFDAGTVDTLQLSLIHGAGPAEFSIVPVSHAAPPGATSLVRYQNNIMVGTRELGVARFELDASRAVRWLRRGQMFIDATTLSVACHSASDCWIATGARRAWHNNGERFVAGGPDNVVLAVIRDRNNDIYAFHRTQYEKAIHVARISPVGSAGQGASQGATQDASTDRWTELPGLTLQLPGQAPEISFARFDSAGQLWVGLRFREQQEVQAWGVATMNIAANRVSYHRTTNDVKLRAAMLPIPIGVMDGDLSGTDAWFATSEGVARLRDKEVMVWNESNGVQSEYTRAIAVATNGDVYTGTSAGLGIFSAAAATWDFPKNAGFPVLDVVLDASNAPWMATDRGIATFLDGKVKRLDTRAGLVENSIVDLAVDHLGRIWARGPNSLTVVETGK
nr:hypothetical protein [Kofleriaceae bacterium]